MTMPSPRTAVIPGCKPRLRRQPRPRRKHGRAGDGRAGSYGRADSHGQSLPAPRFPAQAAGTVRAVIGDELRMPIMWCEMGSCISWCADPSALGEADARARAISVGWRVDALGPAGLPAMPADRSALLGDQPGRPMGPVHGRRPGRLGVPRKSGRPSRPLHTRGGGLDGRPGRASRPRPADAIRRYGSAAGI